MTLKVGEHKHGVVVCNIFSNVVFLDNLAVRNIKLEIGSLAVKQINVKVLCPAVILEKLDVPCGGISCSVIGSVALNDCATHVLDDLAPEFGMKEILITLLT